MSLISLGTHIADPAASPDQEATAAMKSTMGSLKASCQPTSLAGRALAGRGP